MSGRLMQILLITTLSYQLWIKVWLTKKTNQQVVHNFGYTPLWVDKQIIKACLPKEEFFYGQKRFSLYD